MAEKNVTEVAKLTARFKAGEITVDYYVRRLKELLRREVQLGYEREKESMLCEIGNLKERTEDFLKALESQKEAQVAETGNYEQTIAEYKETVSQYEKHIETLMAENEALKDTCTRFQEEIKRLNEQLSSSDTARSVKAKIVESLVACLKDKLYFSYCTDMSNNVLVQNIIVKDTPDDVDIIMNSMVNAELGRQIAIHPEGIKKHYNYYSIVDTQLLREVSYAIANAIFDGIITNGGFNVKKPYNLGGTVDNIPLNCCYIHIFADVFTELMKLVQPAIKQHNATTQEKTTEEHSYEQSVEDLSTLLDTLYKDLMAKVFR